MRCLFPFHRWTVITEFVGYMPRRDLKACMRCGKVRRVVRDYVIPGYQQPRNT